MSRSRAVTKGEESLGLEEEGFEVEATGVGSLGEEVVEKERERDFCRCCDGGGVEREPILTSPVNGHPSKVGGGGERVRLRFVGDLG